MNEVYNELCQEFGIRPKLVFWREEIVPFYDTATDTIVMPNNSWSHPMGRKGLLVHEFTHALYGHRGYYDRYYHDHGKKFYKTLVEVIDQAYVKPHYYPWRNEYANIQKWAIADGYWKNG